MSGYCKKVPSKLISRLKEIVGPGRVSTSEAVCQAYVAVSGVPQPQNLKPDIVVLAETTEQVSEIVKAANYFMVPVTPRGAIGAPVKGGILLDLSLMDKILTVDSVNMKAVAEAGCSFFKLNQELFKHGLMLPSAFYGPGPCVASSVILPAQGIGGARYGANITLVEGFEVVLPSGEIVKVGSMAYFEKDFGPSYRYVWGPDLVGLFTKSNGAFGIVTKVAYRCVRRPKHWAFYSAYWPFENLENSSKVVLEGVASEIFEVHWVDRWWLSRSHPGLPEECQWVVTFAVNANNERELEGKVQFVKELCDSYEGKYFPSLAEDLYTRWPTKLWDLGFIPMQGALKTKRMRAQITGMLSGIHPISRLPEFVAKVSELFKQHQLWSAERGPGFDGFPLNSMVMNNIVVYLIDPRDRDMAKRVVECRAEFEEWFAKKGGVYQGREMRGGLTEPTWMNQMEACKLLRIIKAALDPNNVLSPETFELKRGC